MTRRDILAGAALAAAGGGAGAAASGHPDLGLFKAVYLVKRRSDFTYDAFERHQEDVHVPLAQALPGLRRYRLDYFRPFEDGAEQPYDAMATVWFDDKAAHDAALASEQGAAALADFPNYLDADKTIALFGVTGVARDDFGD